MKKSVVEESTGLVINVIEIKDGSKWTPPEGCVLMVGGEIGDTWNKTTQTFVKPAQELVPEELDIRATLDNHEQRITNIEEGKKT